MSAAANSGLKPLPNGEAGAEVENEVSASAPVGDKSSRAPSISSKEDSPGTGGDPKANSSILADTTNPLPPPAPDSADQQSDVASAISNGSQSENKSARSRTRSSVRSNQSEGKQNGDKRYQEQDSSPNCTDSEDEKDPYLNALASTLARFDERAYKKALFQDANAIFDKILFPMSFPWSHRVMPVVRNVPRDIDEMPAILSIDDAEHEVCALKHSVFDLYQSQVGFEKRELLDDEEKIPAVARRADDPGEIELITSAPSVAKGNSPSPGAEAAEDCLSVLFRDPLIEPIQRPVEEATSPCVPESGQDEVLLDTPGEAYFQAFEQVQDKKRRRLEAGLARLKTLRISVRVDSTSSRMTLFQRSSENGPLPLLLPATLPDGFRAGLKGKSASRAPQGRSQMTWIEKNSLTASHRVTFKSYLSGEKVENGSQKRPREVALGIRVNGKLVSSDQIKAEQLTKEYLSSSRKQTDGKIKALYAPKLVSDAIKGTGLGKDKKVTRRICTMDTEAFTKRILSCELSKEKSIGWNNKITIKSLNLVYVTPRIDCLPTEDGLVRVLCTSPGELPPSNVEKVFNQACRSRNPPVCTVCWRNTSVTGELLSTCVGCGVLIHFQSCQSQISQDPRRQKCASCFFADGASSSPSSAKKAAAGLPLSDRAGRRSSRTPQKTKDGSSPMGGVQVLSCALCPHTGGTLSMVQRDGKNIWVHDVCRIWCDQSTEPKSEPKRKNGSKSPMDGMDTEPDDLTCVVCGETNDSDDQDGIVKCAAAGCSLYFHPMCALYISKCEEIGGEKQNSIESETPDSIPSAEADDMVKKITENDNRLCRQYSLRFAKCAIPDSHYARNPAKSTSVLPVCFCGIHNPKRDRSLYGLYPGGSKMINEEVMRVPAKKVNKKEAG